MRILLLPMGSFGDVNPFIGLGLALQQRGHDVIVIANAYFERAVKQAGIGFAPSTPAEFYMDVLNNPDTWHPRKGPAMIPRRMLAAMPDTFAAIGQLNQPGNTVMGATPLALAATIAYERLGIPLTALVINPMLLRSAYDSEDRRLSRFRSLVRRWKARGRFRLYDLLCDKVFRPEVNVFRAEIGLAPVRRMRDLWGQSLQRVVGLWPEWLYGPKPDWPPQAVVTGFIEYDSGPAADSHDTCASMGLGARETAGRPPIVFTVGTACLNAPDFFAAACAACEILDWPGVLLTQSEQPLGRPLTRLVRHIRYAPLGKLLPRAAAIVHHGGIGTAARALKAGIPQLVMPMAYDQHDNAERLTRLGVAAAIEKRRFTPENVAVRLRELLDSKSVLERCRYYAAKFDGNRALENTCDYIESSVREAADARRYE